MGKIEGKHIHLEHPLLMHKIGYLRDKNTQSNEFRDIMAEISKILTYEVMRDWKYFDHVEVETPIAKAKIKRIINPPIVVSIMRAGNGMLDAVLSMIPFASAGHIGIYRDKFLHTTVEYYFKMPQNSKAREVIVVDPLLATGDTIVAALDRLKQYEVGKIRFVCILASRNGLDKIKKYHPDVDVYYANVESDLNESGYLVPGLGDAGDRLYQTK